VRDRAAALSLCWTVQLASAGHRVTVDPRQYTAACALPPPCAIARPRGARKTRRRRAEESATDRQGALERTNERQTNELLEVRMKLNATVHCSTCRGLAAAATLSTAPASASASASGSGAEASAAGGGQPAAVAGGKRSSGSAGGLAERDGSKRAKGSEVRAALL
jgi:hypothetical protein